MGDNTDRDTSRHFESGWLVAAPTVDPPRIAFARMSVEVGRSALIRVWMEASYGADMDEWRRLEYMRSRATVSMFGTMEPFGPWERDYTTVIPVTYRVKLRALVDDPTSDLSQLFTAICAQMPDEIASLDTATLTGVGALNEANPAIDHVWRPRPGYEVAHVAPWWNNIGNEPNPPGYRASIPYSPMG